MDLKPAEAQKSESTSISREGGDSFSVTAAGAGDTAAAAEASYNLVAKWQGRTIELPALPASTTIAEVKVTVPRIVEGFGFGHKRLRCMYTSL